MSPVPGNGYQKLFFENRTPNPIHLVLLAARGTLEMHMYAQRTATSIEIAPGTCTSVDVDDALRACIKGRKLSFDFRSHLTARPRTYFVPGRDLKKDAAGNVEGPIFSFETDQN